MRRTEIVTIEKTEAQTVTFYLTTLDNIQGPHLYSIGLSFMQLNDNYLSSQVTLKDISSRGIQKLIEGLEQVKKRLIIIEDKKQQIKEVLSEQSAKE